MKKAQGKEQLTSKKSRHSDRGKVPAQDEQLDEGGAEAAVARGASHGLRRSRRGFGGQVKSRLSLDTENEEE